MEVLVYRLGTGPDDWTFDLPAGSRPVSTLTIEVPDGTTWQPEGLYLPHADRRDRGMPGVDAGNLVLLASERLWPGVRIVGVK